MVTLQRKTVQSRPEHVRRAFTLIELLVVVAIVALLVAMFAPSVSRTLKLARTAKCGTNLRRIGEAVANHQVNEPDTKMFAGGWQSTLLPYVADNRDVYVCSEYAEDDVHAEEIALTELVYFEVNHTHKVDLKEGQYMVKLNQSQFDDARAQGWLGNGNESNNMPTSQWKYIDDGTGVYWLCMEDYGGDWDFKDVMCRVTDEGDGTTKLHMISGYTGHYNALKSKEDNSEIVYIGSNNTSGVDHVVETGSTKTSYGMNAQVAEILNKGSRMLVMDYSWVVARSSHDWSKQEGEVKGVPMFARHMGKMNVLLTGQEVITLRPEEVDPGDYMNLQTLWMP